MPVEAKVYLNGAFLKTEDAKISPLDRGFLFAHAAYEVTAVYNKKLVDFEGHMARLSRTLDAISIPNPHAFDDWRNIHEKLLIENTMHEGLIYLEISAGTYHTRDFAGPETFSPTVFLFADGRPLITDAAKSGIAAIFTQDIRWKRRDLKTVQLLSQALAYRTAREADATTAIMVEDGMVTEAASANVWIVTETGQLVTRNLSTDILPGITRASSLQQLSAEGVQVEERAFSPDEVFKAREVFTTSAGALIAPVVSIEGHIIGEGTPGPVTRLVQRLYYETIGVNVAEMAPWAAAP